MTEQEMRKGGGGKLSRTETVTVRLDPKLRYLAELAARLHRRTLSSYIEWTIKESLDSERVRDDRGNQSTIGAQAEYLWDVDDADRFVRLALSYPHLLTHEEQVRWKLIRECGHLWRGSYGTSGTDEFRWRVAADSLYYDRLRENWELFCAVASGDKPSTELPSWDRRNRTAAPKSEYSDDDIPF